jgi:hypothetical protein
VSAIATHFRSGQQDLEAEVTLDLPPQSLERLTEELFHFAATQADDVRVLLLHAGLVVMLIPAIVHQVQLIHKTALFQQLERAVYGDTVEFGILLLGHLEQTFRVQMFTRLVQQIHENLPLPGGADASFFEGTPDGLDGHNNSTYAQKWAGVNNVATKDNAAKDPKREQTKQNRIP